MDSFLEIREKFITDPSNIQAFERGHEPVYTVAASAKIVIVGQAPGRIAQATKKPWNDVSGVRLRQWLNMGEDTFYDESLVALIPMDFYYPGKGVHGDLPPRSGFAQKWPPTIALPHAACRAYYPRRSLCAGLLLKRSCQTNAH